MTRSREPGRRAGLSRRSVVSAAGALVEEKGLSALTMRAVATRLGVAPNAIYSHVSSKTDLIDALLDDLLQQVDESPVSEPGADPVDGLRTLMASTYHVLLSQPDLVPLALARQGSRGPQAQHFGETMSTLLERAGITGPAGRDAIRVLVVYTIGFAAVAARPAPDLAVEGGPLPADEADRSFDEGLRWLLAGIVAGVVTAT